jgi:hypothetical protein
LIICLAAICVPKKGALEIDRHYPFILIFGCVEDRGARLDPGVVDHDVHPAELAHGPVDEHLQVGELAHIGFDADRLIAELADLLLERLGRLGMADIVNDDIGVQPREFENNRLADPAIATGDDGNFAPRCRSARTPAP